MSNLKTIPAPPGYVAVFISNEHGALILREEPVLFFMVVESHLDDQVEILPVLFDSAGGAAVFKHLEHDDFVCFKMPGHWKEASSADIPANLLDEARERVMSQLMPDKPT